MQGNLFFSYRKMPVKPNNMPFLTKKKLVEIIF